MNTSVFKISGIHCPACKMLIEDVVGDIAGIRHALVNETNHTLTIETDTPISASEWLPTLVMHLQPFRYTVTLNESNQLP